MLSKDLSTCSSFIVNKNIKCARESEKETEGCSLWGAKKEQAIKKGTSVPTESPTEEREKTGIKQRKIIEVQIQSTGHVK